MCCFGRRVQVKHDKVLLVDHVFWDLTLYKLENSRLRDVTSQKIRSFIKTSVRTLLLQCVYLF